MFERLYCEGSLHEAQELVHRLLDADQDAFDPRADLERLVQEGLDDQDLDPLSYAHTTVNAEEMAKELGFEYLGKSNPGSDGIVKAIWSKQLHPTVQARMNYGDDPTSVSLYLYPCVNGAINYSALERHINVPVNKVRDIVQHWVGQYHGVPRLHRPQEGLDDEIPDLMAYANKAARKPFGYMMRLPAFLEVNGKKYPRQDVWLNTRKLEFEKYIGDGTVFKRQSTTKQWPHLETVPVYADPRKYGEKVLDPNFVPTLRGPRLESLDDEIRDLKDYAMQHGLPPRIKITFNKTTPESAEYGDFSESGWVNEEGVSMATDELDREEGKTCVDLAVEFLWKEGASMESSSQFEPDGWYSSGWSQNYRTGEETEHNYHLQGFTPEQEREIYDKLTAKRRQR